MAPLKSRRGASGSQTVAKQVRQILASRVEHKNAVGLTNNIDWSSSGVVSLLSTDIAQGDNIGNRSGDSIRPLKLTFRITSFNTVNGAARIFRFIVFQDTMSYGSTPIVTDVLATADYMSPFNAPNQQAKRFKILCDHYGANVFSAADQVVEITKVIKMKGVIQYISTAAAAASAGKNTIYVLFINDSTGAANQYMYKWSYQLEYLDA